MKQKLSGTLLLNLFWWRTFTGGWSLHLFTAVRLYMELRKDKLRKYELLIKNYEFQVFHPTKKKRLKKVLFYEHLGKFTYNDILKSK